MQLLLWLTQTLANEGKQKLLFVLPYTHAAGTPRREYSHVAEDALTKTIHEQFINLLGKINFCSSRLVRITASSKKSRAELL